MAVTLCVLVAALAGLVGRFEVEEIDRMSDQELRQHGREGASANFLERYVTSLLGAGVFVALVEALAGGLRRSCHETRSRLGRVTAVTAKKIKGVPTMNAAKCPSCEVALPPSEVAAGWCEACGKRLPASITAGPTQKGQAAEPFGRPSPPDGKNVSLGNYLFVEAAPGKLLIQTSPTSYVTGVILGAILSCGGVVASVALAVAHGLHWGLVATGAVTVLGGWALLHTLMNERTIWTLDRESDTLTRRDEVVRPLSSIPHVARFAIPCPTSSGREVILHYVGFAPIPGEIPLPLFCWRKDLLCFTDKPEQAAQAATLLAAFLGVEVIR
jgi:hypothetical protein